jgi:hypothetical protein
MNVADHNDSAIKNHLDPKYLTELEKTEIKKYKDVYYIGHKAHLRKVAGPPMQHKDGFRDKENNYKALVGDHIGYRFEIIRVIGSGAFGKVLEVMDHKHSRKYALKILKVSEELYQQFKLEIKILKLVKDQPSTNKNIVEIKGDFEFRGHIVLTILTQCIVTEMLSMNVYSYIKAQNYQGFDVDIVRKILIQLMQALLLLHHVPWTPPRRTSSTATSSPKTWSSRNSASQESNSSTSARPASTAAKNSPTSRAGTTAPQKSSS